MDWPTALDRRFRQTHWRPSWPTSLLRAQNGDLPVHGRGPSQVETFDPKPELNRLHGQPVPASLGKVTTQQASEKSLLLGVKRQFRPCGESGLVMSDLFPHLATCADDLSVVRSMHAESIVHSAALLPDEHGPHTDGSSDDRCVADLRAGQRER
ncbi:MAG: hypothetical protein Ct9H300mP1_09760 [Planctomycetaceae bacterium]|nr:MAG: hypothetical protein Ct9H300mP1_09760 [Planctomycetaceae bacterium]